jgi:nucleotide-binding universal stress UspA family protein
MLKIKSILFPIDFSKGCRKALLEACDTAHILSARLILLHVASPTGLGMADNGNGALPGPIAFEAAKEKAKKNLIDLLAKVVPPRLEATATLAEGDPVEQILKVAEKEKVGLIIMYSKGGRLKTNLNGKSVVKNVSKHAKCKVNLIDVLT